jgi:glucose-6-phosphate isomerase
MEGMFRLLYGGALSSKTGPKNVTKEELEDLDKKMASADSWLSEGREAGREGFGWLDLPWADISEIKKQGEWLGKFESIIQIGIGGSALGNRMLNNALLHPYYNELPANQRKGPRYYLAENIDPASDHAIWNRVDPSSVALLVISKSGSTAETMANFLFFFEKLKDSIGEEEALKRVLVVTDPEKGNLRALAKGKGCRSLDIPPGVGGRYSVLSSVGLAAACAMGIDVDMLLKGARSAMEKITKPGALFERPCHLLSALSWLHGGKGRTLDVLMPYSDRLSDFVEWYAQLWAESIGKEGKGFTPVRALGAVDQHSQVQLYTEGPDDKLFTLIDVQNRSKDIDIPLTGMDSLSPLAYMGKGSMNRMISHEARSTAAAILKSGKPVLWIVLPRIDEEVMGALIFFYQYATALTGYLLSIDPFDQPGVEQGKKYTYGLMGRDGYSDHAAEVREIFRQVDSASSGL